MLLLPACHEIAAMHHRSATLVLAVLCVIAGSPTLQAQGLGATLPIPGPQPGFLPVLPIPGTFSPNLPPAAIVPSAGFAWPMIGQASGFIGGFGFTSGIFLSGPTVFYPWIPYLSYGPAGVGRLGGPSPLQEPQPIAPLQGAGSTARTDLTTVVSNQMPARLRVCLPSAGELWWNGIKQPETASEFHLTSPPARIGTEVRYQILARWKVDGIRYQADRTVRVLAGDRSTLTIVSGDPEAATPNHPSTFGP